MNGESSLAAYLSNGQVVVIFKPKSEVSTVTASSDNSYSDSQRYHVTIVFDEGELTLTVNETDSASVDSKPPHIHTTLTFTCILNSHL